jgi:hypothetical protein
MNWFKSLWKKLTAPPACAPRVNVQTRTKSTPGVPQESLGDEHIGTFTSRAQQALALARKEADRLNHNFLGTEHLLLGMIALGQGVAVNVLRKMGLDLETVRTGVKKMVGTGPGQGNSGNAPYTPRLKKVLALATKEARALNHTYVGTEHILLGLLREGDGVAAHVLKNLGVDIKRTRQEILKELDPNYQLAADATGASPSTTSPASSNYALRPCVDSPQLPGEAVDLGKRYDIYCTDWSQGVTVYRNARFKGIKHLFPKSQYDALSGFVELEQGDGQTIFVSRSSIIRFCEHGVTPGPESDSGQKP